MLETMIVRHCSPTLAGLKTAGMFTFPFPDDREMCASLLQWNHRLARKGICVLPLRRYQGRTLIYLYRPSSLSRDLRHPQVRALLSRYGYSCEAPARCIARLMHRLRECEQFPHEVGLFLGYPPEDVRGFMEDPAACKLTGCWKVYGDVESARTQFDLYWKCTRLYCERLRQGTPVERLAVFK